MSKDRKSTRLNSSHGYISYAVFCLKKKNRYYFSIDDDEETCNVELWKNEFYSYGRDNIIPVQNILYRFVPVKCKISNCQAAIEYLAINPINRKFHIR